MHSNQRKIPNEQHDQAWGHTYLSAINGFKLGKAVCSMVVSYPSFQVQTIGERRVFAKNQRQLLPSLRSPLSSYISDIANLIRGLPLLGALS